MDRGTFIKISPVTGSRKFVCAAAPEAQAPRKTDHVQHRQREILCFSWRRRPQNQPMGIALGIRTSGRDQRQNQAAESSSRDHATGRDCCRARKAVSTRARGGLFNLNSCSIKTKASPDSLSHETRVERPSPEAMFRRLCWDRIMPPLRAPSGGNF
jgi:hypothetical protein